MKIESFTCSSEVFTIWTLRQDDFNMFKFKDILSSEAITEEYVQKRLKKTIIMITDHHVPIHICLNLDDELMIASSDDYVRLRAVQEILRTPFIESMAVSVIIFPNRKSFLEYIDNEHVSYVEKQKHTQSDYDDEDIDI